MKKRPISELEHEISRTRQDIVRNKKKLSRLTRQLPKEEIEKDYSLKDWNGRDVKFSRLFGESNDLILVHNMGSQCPYCTLWADGFSGLVKHLEDRASFVVVSPDTPKFKRNSPRAEDGNLRCCPDMEPPLSKIWASRIPSADSCLVCRCFTGREIAESFVLQ